MKNKILLLLALALSTINSQLSTAFAQGNAFTYQGRLTSGANGANGSYDLTFALFNVSSGAGQVGGTLTNTATAVSNGLFTVTLDFGANFPGADRWLEIAVRTNGAGTFTNLAPRQKITPTPYAITASNLTGTLPAAQLSGNLPAGSLAGTYGSAVTLNNAANSFTGNGTGLTNVNASTLGGLSSSNFWRTGGNAGTTPGPQFLGTTDNLPVEIRVNGQRALRLEPTPSGTPNIIAGSAANSVAAGASGVTIGGGGNNLADTGTGFATIGGGQINAIHAGSYESTIGGGYRNTIETFDSTIGGGAGNTIQTNSQYSTIGGGVNNRIFSGALLSTIGGGSGNLIESNAPYSAIPGGVLNTAGGQSSFAAGYRAKAMHQGSFVWADSTDADFASTGNDQFLIRAGGGVGLGVNAPQQKLSVGAGLNLDQNNGNSGSVANALTFGSSSGEGIASKRNSGGNQFGLDFYTGSLNRLSIANDGNIAIAAPGSLSFGAQTRQMLNLFNTNYGIGVQDFTLYFRCDANTNVQFAGFRWYAGGAHTNALGNAGGGDELMSLGRTYLYVNGTFVSSSDRNKKENFAPIQPREVLEKVVALPITRWNYKSDAATPHLGPMAQDFYAAFNVGTDDKHIATIDESGVALAAIQGLNQKVEELNGQLKRSDAENAALKRRLEKLEGLMNEKNGGGK